MLSNKVLSIIGIVVITGAIGISALMHTINKVATHKASIVLEDMITEKTYGVLALVTSKSNSVRTAPRATHPAESVLAALHSQSTDTDKTLVKRANTLIEKTNHYLNVNESVQEAVVAESKKHAKIAELQQRLNELKAR